jgi:hypothetical protein
MQLDGRFSRCPTAVECPETTIQNVSLLYSRIYCMLRGQSLAKKKMKHTQTDEKKIVWDIFEYARD